MTTPLTARASAILAGLALLAGPAAAQMRITEYMYQGADGEFVEFTNVGAEPIDLAGWSFDDDSAIAGTVALGSAGVVRPGESVILTEAPADDFRKAWGLCPDAKVVGGNTTNLGRNDAIHLFDAAGAQIDALRFGDQNFPGSFRTNGISAWVPAAALGLDEVIAWIGSSLDDAEHSHASVGGDVGSPGFSARAAAPYSPCVTLGGVIRITEYMYKGADEEFVELTNVGDQPVDLAGWSFADDAATPGLFDLSPLGTVQAGESVLIVEHPQAAFRAAWALCDGVGILTKPSPGLGRNDQINLYDAEQQLVDRLTYGDQTFPGSFRTEAISAWVPAAALGADDVLAWQASAPGDAEGSYLSAGGDLGSPARSTRAVVTYDPCIGQPEAPTLTVDAVATAAGLDLAINGSGAVGAAIGDPTDPAAVGGIGFVLGVPEGGDIEALTVSVSSSDPTVVDAAGLKLSGSGAARQLRIVPAGVGRATITVRVADSLGNAATYAISYAASAAAPDPAAARFPTGASDASAAIALDAQTMIVGDDENQVLRLYRRDRSGLPLGGFDFTDRLGLTDLSGGVPREIDIEAVERSGDRLYWTGSHGNGKEGQLRPNRQRVFATDLSGAGEAATLAYVGRYDHLRTDLIAWDEADGHGLGAGALGFAAGTAAGITPDQADGFNIEGLAIAPDGSSAYLAFRAPLLPADARRLALIVPVHDFDALVSGGAPDSLPAGSARFGTPILLDLGGRSLRSLDRNANGDYLISAGSVDGVPSASRFALFGWNGHADGVPFPLGYPLADLANDGSVESFAEVPAVLGAGTALQLLTDNGDTVWYADGVAAKDIADKRLTKFRTDTIRLNVPPPSDVIFLDALDGR
ncbi:MAG: lamin tail domain-containing protein [Dokdonella sp.]|nr:lamin tail domain-containing protein [Dokdonella sp.]